MVSIPYTAFSDRDLDAIIKKLRLQTTHWIAEQFGPIAAEALHVTQPFLTKELPASNWEVPELDIKGFGSCAGRYASIRVTALTNQWVSLVGLPSTNISNANSESLSQAEISILLSAIADSFLQTLSATTEVALLSLTTDELIKLAPVKGSGILMLKLQFSGLLIEGLIFGGIFKAPKPKSVDTSTVSTTRKKLSARAGSISGFSLNLKATLGFTELSVGDVGQISVGDIIRFDQSINEPIKLFNTLDEIVCYGSLGKQESHKALLLSK